MTERRILVVITALMFSVIICLMAQAADIPDDVYRYASTECFDGLKAFIKGEANGFIGDTVNSCEDVDALVLGKGYRTYRFDTEKLTDEKNDKLSELLLKGDKWYFTADTPSGEAVSFLWVYKDGDTLSNGGGGSAEMFGIGREIMERVIKSNNDSAEPMLIEYAGYLIFVYHTDGNDYVLPVLGNMPIDESFLKVTSYKQLPTASELIKQVRANYEASFTQPDTICGGADLILKANLNPPDDNLPKVLIITIIAIGSVLFSAAAITAVIIIKKRKSKSEY